MLRHSGFDVWYLESEIRKASEEWVMIGGFFVEREVVWARVGCSGAEDV